MEEMSIEEETPRRKGGKQPNDFEWMKFLVSFHPDMVAKLDEQASSLGLSRTALMRIIIAKHFGDF